MSMRTHQIHVTKTVQLVDLNNNENKCITTFNITPSDITVPYDVAVVSQNTIDSSENWQDSSTFKRFSGNVTNTVEIEDDTPQSYYLAFKSSPNSSEPIALNISISSTPLQVPAQAPAVPQPVILETFEDEIIKDPWYRTPWGILLIIIALASIAYFGYTLWQKRQSSKDVKFKPLVQEKTIPANPPPSIPFSFMDNTPKSEYKSHKYRSRDRIKPDFAKSASVDSPPRMASPPRVRSSPSRSVPVIETPAPAPAPSIPVETPAIPSTPVPAPPVEAPKQMEPTNRITSKLFEKLRSGITMI